jgi:hypothetical protein
MLEMVNEGGAVWETTATYQLTWIFMVLVKNWQTKLSNYYHQ